MTTTLIIGANGAIASALVASLACKRANDNSEDTLLRVSHSPLPDLTTEQQAATTVHCLDLLCDYSPAQIKQCCATILSRDQTIDTIYICNGVLHGNLPSNEQTHAFFPEKKIEDLDIESLQHVMYINAFLPLLWLQHLNALFANKHPCKIVCFSARVGSISDNRLGGWYSYRASKAALNMLMKTLSIEYARRFKQVKLVVFHPGTTDTRLSEPFQANVPEEQLFTAEFVSQRLLDIVATLEFDGQLSYLDWDNKPIQF